MKRIVLKVCSIIFVLFGVIACSEYGNASSPVPENLYGTWSDQIGNRYIEFSFNIDDSGTFVYSSRAYYRVAVFTYYMKKGVVYCDGTCVHENGDVEDPWHMELEYSDDRLVPLNSYKEYVLHR